MEHLITLDGMIGALVILAVFILMSWGLVALVAGDSSASPAHSQPEGETVGERLMGVVTTAPLVLDTDPALTTLEATRQTVEEQADAATLDVLHKINESFGGNNND